MGKHLQLLIAITIFLFLSNHSYGQEPRSELIIKEGSTVTINKNFPTLINLLILEDNSTLKAGSDIEKINLKIDHLKIGKNVKIKALGESGTNGTSHAGNAPRRTSRSTTTGRTGSDGGNGENGVNGKDVIISANKLELVSFTVDTSGGNGGNGGAGQGGGKGANADCPAGNGGTGGRGGRGGNGGRGGDAGKVTIRFNEFKLLQDPNTGAFVNNPYSWIATGGTGGEGGNAGGGGSGGNSGCCADCPWPTSGCCLKVDGGDRGSPGSKGSDGGDGSTQDTDKAWFAYHGTPR